MTLLELRHVTKRISNRTKTIVVPAMSDSTSCPTGGPNSGKKGESLGLVGESGSGKKHASQTYHELGIHNIRSNSTEWTSR
ncbi:hypothetical protein GCM10020331_060090 [Ectobacillus funiculus]